MPSSHGSVHKQCREDSVCLGEDCRLDQCGRHPEEASVDVVEGIRHCMVDRKGRGEHSIHHNELLLPHHRVHSLALHLLNGRDLLLSAHSAHTVLYMQRSSSLESEGRVLAGSSHQKMLRRQLKVHAVHELEVKEGGGKIVGSVRHRDDGGEGSLAKRIATEDAVSHLDL